MKGMKSKVNRKTKIVFYILFFLTILIFLLIHFLKLFSGIAVIIFDFSCFIFIVYLLVFIVDFNKTFVILGNSIYLHRTRNNKQIREYKLYITKSVSISKIFGETFVAFDDGRKGLMLPISSLNIDEKNILAAGIRRLHIPIQDKKGLLFK